MIDIGRFWIRRSGPRSMNGHAINSPNNTLGTMNVAMMSGRNASWFLKTLSSSNRKKKYHSGRGT